MTSFSANYNIILGRTERASRVDVAYCCIRSSVMCLRLCVCRSRQWALQNDWTDRYSHGRGHTRVYRLQEQRGPGYLTENRRNIYLYFSKSWSSSVKYSKHNIQQNNQTKKKKKLGVSGPLERSWTVQCMRSIRAPSAACCLLQTRCVHWSRGRRRGVVVSGVCLMNEVNARRARLVLGWVTVFGRVYHLGM